NVFVGGWTQSQGPTQVTGTTVPFPAFAVAGAGCSGPPGPIFNTIKFGPSSGVLIDGFAAKFNRTGCLLCANFLGGDGNDKVIDGSITSSGSNFVVIGWTTSD